MSVPLNISIIDISYALGVGKTRYMAPGQPSILGDDIPVSFFVDTDLLANVTSMYDKTYYSVKDKFR